MPPSPSSPSGGSVRAAASVAALFVLRATLAFSAPGEPGRQETDLKAEASAHLRRGAELIDAEDLEGALAQFEAAYRLVPSPNILHNFGIVYQGMGRKAAALDSFQRFLGEASHPPPAAREHAQRAVQSLLAEVADLRVEADVTGATIFIDGRSVGETPRERPIYLDPGPHHLSVEKSGLGTIHAERVEVRAGQHLTVSARPARFPAPTGAALPVRVAEVVNPSAPPVRPTPRRWQRPVAWGAAVGAALAAGVLATEVFLHYRSGTDFNQKECGAADPGQGGADCADLLSRANEAEKWAVISGLTAGALAIGAVVLFVSLPERSGGHAIAPLVSPSQLGLVLHWRF